MQIKILGNSVEVYTADGAKEELSGKAAAAVVILSQTTQPVAADRLLEDLSDADAKSGSFRNTMSDLRKLFGTDKQGNDILDRDRSGYRLQIRPTDYVDITAFTEISRRAESARESDPYKAAELYRYALSLWGDQPLEGLPSTHGCERIRESLLQRRNNTIEVHAMLLLRLGRHQEAIDPLAAAVASAPRREGLRRLLMWALYLDGRGSDALPLFDNYARELHELGAEPSYQIRLLYETIRTGDKNQVLHLTPPELPASDRAVIASGATDKLSMFRMSDYLLGGQYHSWPDRAATDIILALVPDVTDLEITAEVWVYLAAQWGAEQGITQYIDIGAGHVDCPHNLSAALRFTALGATIIYTHAQQPIITYAKSRQPVTDKRIHYVHAGMEASPEAFLDHPEITAHLDYSKPIMFMLREEEANSSLNLRAKVTAIKNRMVPGSCLVLTRPLAEMSDKVAHQLAGLFGDSSPLTFTTVQDTRELLEGFELAVGPDDTFRLLTDPGDRVPGQFRAIGVIAVATQATCRAS